MRGGTPGPGPRRALAGGALAVALATAACSLVTDLDGLGGHAALDPGPSDADGDATSTPGSAPPDGQVSDAPTAFDGGDAVSPVGCASLGDAALLCDDFEREELAAPQWGFVVRPSPDAGTLALEPRPAGTEGRFLHVALPALPAGYAGQDEPHLRRDFEERVSRIVVAFDLARFDTGRASGRQIMLVRVNGADAALAGGRAFLSFVDDQLLFVQQEARTNGETTSQSLAPLPAGSFGRYEMTLDLLAHVAELRVNGALRVSVPLSAELAPATFSVSAGFRFASLPATALDVGIDQIAVTAR